MAETTQTSHIDDRWDSFAMEPVPEFDGDYCYTHQTECGHIWMLSDTPDQEFILLNHANGSYTMHMPSGKVQANTNGDFVHLIVKNNKIWIKGSSLVHIDENANINVGKNAYVGVNGDLDVKVDGNARLTSKKTLTLQGDRVDVVSKKGVTYQGSEMHFPSDVYVHGDLHVQQDITSVGNINSSSAIKAECGLLTPGSLVVGPLAYVMELPMLILNFCSIQTVGVNPLLPYGVAITSTGPMLIESLSYTSVGAATYMDVSAGGALTIDAGGVVDILAGGAVTINAGGAVEIGAAGLIDISAAGAVGIAGSSVLIEPDFSVGPVLSFLAHVHTTGIPGSPTGIPYTPA